MFYARVSTLQIPPMSVHEFIDLLPEDARTIVLALRDVVLRTVPNVTESVVWNCLSYHRPEIGGRVKGSVCQIVVRKGIVRLDFIHGVRLHNPKHLLRGTLESKRFIPIHSIKDAHNPEIAHLIREASTLVEQFL